MNRPFAPYLLAMGLALGTLPASAQSAQPSKLLPSRHPQPVGVCGFIEPRPTPFPDPGTPEALVLNAIASRDLNRLRKILDAGASAGVRGTHPHLKRHDWKVEAYPAVLHAFAIHNPDMVNLLIERGALASLTGSEWDQFLGEVGTLPAAEALAWAESPGLSPAQRGAVIGLAFQDALMRGDRPLMQALQRLARAHGGSPHHLDRAYAQVLNQFARAQSEQEMGTQLSRLETILKDHHLDPNQRDILGRPIARAIPVTRASRLLRILLPHGLDPFLPLESSTIGGAPPSDLAAGLVTAGNLQALQILAQHGIRAGRRTDRGHGLLMAAAEMLPFNEVHEVERDPASCFPPDFVPEGVFGGVVGGTIGTFLNDPRVPPTPLLAFLLNTLEAHPTTPRGTIPVLHPVLARGQSEIARMLVATGATLDPEVAQKEHLLAYLAAQGDAALLRWALEHWPQALGVRGHEGFRALATAGNAANVRMLLQAGAPVHTSLPFDHAPVVAAMDRPSTAQLRELLEAGCNPDQLGTDDFEPAVVRAARNGENLCWGRLLRRHGANPNREDPSGWTPLMHAIYTNATPQTLRRLAEWGANPDLASAQDGWTPLMEAAMCGDLPALDLLRALGARVEPRNADGETALDVAHRFNHMAAAWFLSQPEPLVVAIVRFRTRLDGLNTLDPEQLNHRTPEGLHALHVAIQLGAWDQARDLIRHGSGVDLEPKTPDGHTPLQLLQGMAGPQAADLAEDLSEALAKRQERKSHKDN